MEKINFNYSLKNIPLPSKSSYQLKLIDKVESLIKRMRWKAHFFLSNTYDDSNNKKANYGFKTRNYPGQCKELQNFEKDLQDMIKSIKFRKVKDEFQAKMKDDISLINGSTNVFMFADKTTNMYEVSPTEYKKLLHDNITETYRKSTPRLEKAINMKAKYIAKKINLDDRID